MKPHYLAFLCGQALNQQEERLKPVYQEHLTHLAAVLYVQGNFVVSTHSSNIGLFKPEVLMARALLTNTAEVSSAPPKMLTNIEDPDVTEKLKQMRQAGKLAPVSSSPFLTNLRSVDKNKPAPKYLTFDKESEVLAYLLSLSNQDRNDVAQVSDDIDKAKKELEHLMVSKEEEEKYLQMIKETEKMITEIELPTPKAGCQRICLEDERKRIKGQQLAQDIKPDWIKKWKGHDKTTENISKDNNRAVDRVTLKTSNENKKILKERNKPSEHVSEQSDTSDKII